jgi:hypothetical protein
MTPDTDAEVMYDELNDELHFMELSDHNQANDEIFHAEKAWKEKDMYCSVYYKEQWYGGRFL